LHLEDNPGYTELVHSKLDAEGFETEILRVETREDFQAALEQGGYDLIIADYFLPTYDGLKALKLAQQRQPEIPILLVSGTIGEEAAIESLKAGATDYVLKHWPERLIPAVRRALREAEERKSRVQAETTLFRREKHFRAISENSLDVVSLLDQEGVLTYNSPSLHRVLGYQPEELLGQSAFSLIHPDDLARVQEDLRKCIATPQATTTSKFRVRNKDGNWRYLEAICKSFLDDPEVAGVVVNSRDVSERHLVEQALRESEQRFRQLFEDSPDAVLVHDTQGNVLDANLAAARLHGLEREKLAGMNIASLVPQDDREVVLAQFARLAKGELQQLEWKSISANGWLLPVEIRTSLIDYSGKPALLLHMRDISERKKAEEALRSMEQELRQAQKMEAIGQLAGGVAHDFNNILTVIQGHASLLRSSAGAGGAMATSADQICQAAERAAGLTRQLLTFSRRQTMQPKQLDLNSVVSNMTKMLARILGEDIALQFNYAPNLPLVHADAGMIEQVLLNLAVNSRDAMPSGGQLTINIASVVLAAEPAKEHPEGRAGKFVCLSVKDTGSGIDAETLPRIFEPFFTTKEIGKGTGLGLATVYGIMKQHQGWVEVESEPGSGTTFHSYLPSLGETGVPEAETVAAEPLRGGTETILVVEDEGPVRELVCRVLRGIGYEVLQAGSGMEALKIWRQNKDRIDLLLTDIVMPDGMTGRDLAEKAQAEKSGLKAIFTSGYSSDIVGKDFIIEEGVNYLQKPYLPQKLIRVIRKCLDGE
jgi:PAS domain S-box-containing protein